MLKKLTPLAVLALAALVLLAQVLMRPALPVDETRYLAVAWEMRLSGDPFHLTRNFQSYADKPPLLFWLINLVWLVTGVSETAARLVGPAFALVAMMQVARMARVMWPMDSGIGTRAMEVLLGFTVFAVYGGATLFDALLAVTVLAGMAAIWRIGNGEAGRGAWVQLGLAMAAGVLTKGPVVLVHLLPMLVLMPLWAAQLPGWRDLARGFGLALLLTVAVVALWLVPALVLGDAALRHDLLWRQSADRITGAIGHGRPFWFLLALLPVLLFPWGWSWRVWAQMPGVLRGDRAARFCALWAVAALVMFTLIGGKQLHYLLPELAAVALLVARALPAAIGRSQGGSAAALVPLGLAVVALIMATGLVPARGTLADVQPFWAPVLFALLCLGLAALVWRLPLLRGHVTAGLGVAVLLHLLVFTSALRPGFDSAIIAARLAEAAPRGTAVVGMPYNAQFNFTGRLTAPVDLPAPEALAGWIAAHPGGLIVGPTGTAGLPPPPETLRFQGKDFGLWPVDATLISPGSAPGG